MRTYLYLLLLVLVSVPFVVYGQTSNNNFVPLQPNVPGIAEFAKSGSIPELLNNIYKICIGVAATLAVLQIMRAGVMYMGGDSITEKKEARNLISMSVIGLLLVLSPVIVFSIINPDILSLKIGAIELSPVKDQGSGLTENPPATSLTPQQCASKYDPIGSGNKGYIAIENSCCAQLPEGGVCCGVPKTPAPTNVK
jgi:type IV secretory pathway VirB2 component (pilin)